MLVPGSKTIEDNCIVYIVQEILWIMGCSRLRTFVIDKSWQCSNLNVINAVSLDQRTHTKWSSYAVLNNTKARELKIITSRGCGYYLASVRILLGFRCCFPFNGDIANIFFRRRLITTSVYIKTSRIVCETETQHKKSLTNKEANENYQISHRHVKPSLKVEWVRPIALYHLLDTPVRVRLKRTTPGTGRRHLAAWLTTDVLMASIFTRRGETETKIVHQRNAQSYSRPELRKRCLPNPKIVS